VNGTPYLYRLCAKDKAGNTSPGATASATPQAPDTTRPTVTITTPTAAATYSSSRRVLTLGGSAADAGGVAQVTWANDRGGSGTASGTTSWTASGIGLQPGLNTLTVTASDAVGNTGTGTLQVTYTPPISAVGVYRAATGMWYLDANGNGALDGCATDKCIAFGGDPSDEVVYGDWNGSGTTKVGVFRSATGTWYLDTNGNGAWDGCGTDRCIAFGQSGDLPLVGDWNGSGTTKVGVFRPATGTWYLDFNGNGAWEGCGTDRCIAFGQTGDLPLVGDWNGSGTTKVGVFRPTTGTWYLDFIGNGAWDGCGTDKCIAFGQTGDVPVVGKW
jgi:hypothetical protein